jgi:hypothetical protein
MPFNRDLIESGCVLKTFDGDLSVLEQAIDFTVTKSAFSPQKSEAAVVVPAGKKVSTVAACLPREKRHIKEVVYGDSLDELPSTPMQEAPIVSHLVSKQVIDSPAVASGFCFRHLVEEHALDCAVTKSEEALVAPKSEAAPAAPVSNKLSTVEACVARGKRHIKDVVYGGSLDELPSTPMQEVKAVSHPVSKQAVETPAAASGFCFRHVAEDTDAKLSVVPHTRIAVKALVSEVSHHTHWRSEIHGF